MTMYLDNFVSQLIGNFQHGAIIMSHLEKVTVSLFHHVWSAESEGNFRQKKMMTTLATKNLSSQTIEQSKTAFFKATNKIKNIIFCACVISPHRHLKRREDINDGEKTLLCTDPISYE